MPQAKVISRGRITLPKELRDAHNIQDGDTILLADAGDRILIMQDEKWQVDRIANKLAADFRKEGITFEDVLEVIKRIRSK
jgi:AbrB family looped-hinge helix DNA binding protein